MKIIRRIFNHKGAPILTAVFVLLFIVEGKHQLRKSKQPRLKRIIINSIVSVSAFSLLRFLLLPAMVRLAKKNKQLHYRLNYQYKARPVIKGLAAFVIPI